MDKRGDRRMKVIVKFTNEEAEYWGWPQEFLDKQKKQGYIKVKAMKDRSYKVLEEDLSEYKLMQDWIERIVDDESKG
jgi:hypothetical protein